MQIVSAQGCWRTCTAFIAALIWDTLTLRGILRKCCGFILSAQSLSIRTQKIFVQKMVFAKLGSTNWITPVCKKQ